MIINEDEILKISRPEKFNDSVRLDAIANGFSVWQTINLETGTEQWYCQYAIDGIVCGDTLREALDKGMEANDTRSNSQT